MSRLRRIRHDESGMSYVFIGMGLMAFLSASMLAIDVGMLMTSRNQAQTSADAGALAGATALVFNDYSDRSTTGPAVTQARSASLSNSVMGAQVSVQPSDVTFPAHPTTGEFNRVKVDVFRTGARGNPVSTLIAKFFGMSTADIGATATAEASPANAMNCVKPFTIPDKWIEKQTPGWDPSDTFEIYNNKGQPLPNPDVYIPAGQPGYTGYNAVQDKGTPLTIRAGTGNDITPSFYFSLAIGGNTGGTAGGDPYRWNIANCNTTMMYFGDLLTQEPGNMMGPTVSGAWDLYNADPTAYWDTSCNCVKTPLKKSPRVFPIPLYDPVYYSEGKRNGRDADLKVANWLGFFLEEIQGNDIIGRITPIKGTLQSGAGPAPAGAFPLSIRLVK
jgi:Flp pilus assembly protein TadG